MVCKFNMNFADIAVGTVVSFERTITASDVQVFADLTGDHNAVHVDVAAATKTKFSQPIAHGMLVGSLFSTLVGMHCPGEGCVYLSQTLQFRAPVFYGDVVTVVGEVIAKNESLRLLTLKMEARKGSEVVISGEARVTVLPYV